MLLARWPTLGIAVVMMAIGAAVIYKIVRFAFSEVDMQLARLGRYNDAAFDEKVVWLTGASQGLGKALAIRLAELGAKVIVSSRRIEALQLIQDECKGCKYIPKCLPFDLVEINGIETVVETAFSLWENDVDILVHNAGAGQHAAAMDTKLEVDELLFRTNCLSTIGLIKATVPHMLTAGKGQIATTCSLAGLMPSPGQAAYSMSKHALLGWFHSFSAELANTPINFTLVCPGPIATGGEGQPRVIFGTDGVVDHKYSASDKRMPTVPCLEEYKTEKCAHHVLCAIAHKVQESWITPQPLLTLAYLYRLAPNLAWVLIRAAGPKRAQMSSGKSNDGPSKDMYNIRELLFGSRKSD